MMDRDKKVQRGLKKKCMNSENSLKINLLTNFDKVHVDCWKPIPELDYSPKIEMLGCHETKDSCVGDLINTGERMLI